MMIQHDDDGEDEDEDDDGDGDDGEDDREEGLRYDDPTSSRR